MQNRVIVALVVVIVVAGAVARASAHDIDDAGQPQASRTVEEAVDGSTDVVSVLTNDNFYHTVSVAQSQAWFVDFFAPWCGHSQKLAPIWLELATKLRGRIHLASVDCAKHRKLCSQHGVKRLPTIKLFRDGRAAGNAGEEYVGPRDGAEMLKWLENRQVLLPETATEASSKYTGKLHHTPDTTEVVLRYFNTRGRAEVIRLILEQAGVYWYKQVQYTRETWPAAKKQGIDQGLFPFGQVPQLTFGDTGLVQSHAIARYLGERFGLLGLTIDDRALIDQTLGVVEDVRKRYGQLIYSPDFSDDKMSAYLTDVAAKWLPLIEKYLSRNVQDDHAFVLGERVSIADFFVFDLLNVHLGMDKNILDGLTRLQGLHAAVRSLPRIQEYLRSSRRPAHGSGPSAHYDNVARPSIPVDFTPVAKKQPESSHDEL